MGNMRMTLALLVVSSLAPLEASTIRGYKAPAEPDSLQVDSQSVISDEVQPVVDEQVLQVDEAENDTETASPEDVNEQASPGDESEAEIYAEPSEEAGEERILRLCNAFPSDQSMEVRLVLSLNGTAVPLTTEKPLAYKDCTEVNVTLSVGDQIRCTVPPDALGEFKVESLPGQGERMMMLIPYRSGDKMFFESHVFASMDAEQTVARIASIDVSNGLSAADTVDVKMGETTSNINFGTVQDVLPGQYELKLDHGLGEEVSMNLSGGENYVALRVGDADFPEELVVYPTAQSLACQQAPLSLFLMLWLAVIWH